MAEIWCRIGADYKDLDYKDPTSDHDDLVEECVEVDYDAAVIAEVSMAVLAGVEATAR